jgi:hypothetical protein
MTNKQLLARLNSHLTSNSEFAGSIFMPDIFPMIAPALHELTNRVKQDQEKRNLVIGEVLIDITEELADGFYKADLSQGQAQNLLTNPPFPQVSIGANIGALYSSIPPAYDAGCQAFEDTYYIIGKSMIVETTQTLVPGTDQVAIIGYVVPTITNLPPELEDDMIQVIAERLSMLRRSGARKEKQ